MPECAPPRVAAAIARTGGDLSLTTGPQIPGAGVGAAFLCIDDLDPELSWRVSGPVGTVQRAYQIRAASRIGALSRADRWDSGKVSSATSYGIAYAGRRPQSRERIYALPAVFNVLSAAGRDDVVYDLATQTTPPSYGYQLVNGATSLGEAWNGPKANASQNHFMLGAIDEWFTKQLGGIAQADGSVAYRDLVIKPSVVGTLTRVAASYQSMHGTISTDWTRSGSSLRLRVVVPGNSTATVYVPLAATGANRVTAPAGAQFLGNADGFAVYAVGSGTWSFSTR